jgi:hypothetical protein
MKNSTVRPLVKTRIFAHGALAYAWLGADMTIDDWESEMVAVTSRNNAAAHRQAVVSACTSAFRRLQRRHPDKDLVVSVEQIEGIPSIPWQFHLPTTVVPYTSAGAPHH